MIGELCPPEGAPAHMLSERQTLDESGAEQSTRGYLKCALDAYIDAAQLT